MTDDPYHDNKKYHKAAGMNKRGGVTALCFDKPRAINLKRALWAMDPKAVTCKKCLEAMAKEPESCTR